LESTRLPTILNVRAKCLLGSLGYFGQMRSAAECLAKSSEMEAQAATAATPALRSHYFRLAAWWRELAAVAASQRRLAAKP
jgi:hypothetical protein